MFTRPNSAGTAWTAVLYFILIAGVVSLLAGLGGAGLDWFLRRVVQLVYGAGGESVQEVSAHTSPLQRFVILTMTGIVMSLLWWAIRRWGPHAPTPEQAAEGVSMSARWTIAESLIEVANVGAGASIGRESAPREVGAMAADRVSAWARLHPDERAVLIACAAGAGLAATYNVPVAGAVFGIETVLGVAFLRRTPFGHLAIVIPVALAVSYGAVFAGRIIIPNRHVYETGSFDSGRIGSLLAFSAVLGLILGPLGYGAGRIFGFASRHAPRGERIILVMPIGYAILGALAAWQPAIMGNGHLLAQEAFTGNPAAPTLLLLATLKVLATTITMGAGARGGRITPSFSTGTAAGSLGGMLWMRMLPLSLSGATLVGGAAVLAAATASPLTAISLSMEMAGAPFRMVLPTGIAVFLAWGGGYLIHRKLS